MSEIQEVCSVDDIPEGGSKVVDLSGKEVALFNINGEIHVINNSCPHRQGPLGEGELQGNVVTCPFHRWQFDVTTGQSVFPPGQQVACYKVEVRGDKVFVQG